jgi:hypothetical protein
MEFSAWLWKKKNAWKNLVDNDPEKSREFSAYPIKTN